MGMFDDWRPVTKESQTKHNRRTPKRKQRGEFSQKTIKEIRERDDDRCIKCFTRSMIESVPHHIHYKSEGGEGIKRNGCIVCRDCHDWAHHKKDGPNGEPSAEGREWFRTWKEKNLDENGDYIGGRVQWNDRSHGRLKKGRVKN